MIVRTQLTFKEYLNLMYVLSYRKGIMIFLTCCSLATVIVALLNLLGILNTGPTNTTQAIFAFVILLGLPFSVYYTTKKNYDSNKKIQERISYDFSGHEVIITGESFNSTLNLNSSYKIAELSKWFLIYQSNRTVNIIPRSNLQDADQVELRSIFNNLNGVKLKLRKS